MGEDIKNSKYKLQLRIILSLIIILIVGIGIYTKQLFEKTKEHNRAHIKDATVQVSSNISSKFDMYFKELHYIKNNILENNILSKENKNTLLEYKVHAKIFDEVLVVDNQGKGITSSQSNIDIGESLYFKKIKKSKEPCVSEPLSSERLGENIILFSIPQKDNKKEAGYIIGITKSQILSSSLAISIYGKNANTYIINQSGKVIFAKDKGIIGKDIYDTLYKYDIKYNKINYKNEINNENQGTIEYRRNHDSMYLGFSIIPYTNDWYIINEVPEESSLKSTENIVKVLLVIIPIIILTFAIIIVYFFVVQVRLKKAAFRDRITNINNYEKFLLDAKDFINAKRKNRRVILLCFDIDKLKIINDIHGYETGDRILRIIGQNLKDNFGNESVYGRIAGDIFALIVDIELNNKEIQRIVDIIRKDVINLKDQRGIYHVFNIQASIGVYIVKEEDSDIKKILANADMARIKSKENIYKPYIIFDKNMRDEIKLISKLEKNLYSSIENEELEIYYQPKYNINTSQIVGAEALIRWNHSELGLISPIKFIPIAEKNKFINKIGKWVFEEVCRSLRECIDEGIEIVPVAINISRVELYQATLIDNFEKMLKKYNINAGLIEIEITETTALNNLEFINSKLEEIKGLGMKVAMDDFGTGNSNLINLKEISIDVLKLDRSLLKDIENNNKTEVMVKSIVNLSQNLKLTTVCEGVENISQIEIIRNTGCEIVQGFVFSKPVKEEIYKQLLKTNKTN